MGIFFAFTSHPFCSLPCWANEPRQINTVEELLQTCNQYNHQIGKKKHWLRIKICQLKDGSKYNIIGSSFHGISMLQQRYTPEEVGVFPQTSELFSSHRRWRAAATCSSRYWHLSAVSLLFCTTCPVSTKALCESAELTAAQAGRLLKAPWAREQRRLGAAHTATVEGYFLDPVRLLFNTLVCWVQMRMIWVAPILGEGGREAADSYSPVVK